MTTAARLALILCLSGALGGCMANWTLDPYPVYGNPVNPTPAPGYKVQCQSKPGPANIVFNDYLTSCQQIIPPPGVPVLRARG